MNPEIAQMLWQWKLETPYSQPGDWIFASPHKAGRQPYLARVAFQSACETCAAEGWHFCKGRLVHSQALCRTRHSRHTFSSVLKANGEDVKVVQELLRHAASRMTLDTYSQALSPQKRAAQSKVVNMIRPKECVFSVYRGEEGFSA